MGNRRFFTLKFILSTSRIFHSKVPFQLQRIHTLPQRVISQEIIFDIKKCENIWRRSKEDSLLAKHLHDCFVRNGQLLTYAIDMIKCTSNRNSCSSDLVFAVLKLLDDYIRSRSILFNPTLVQKTEVLLSILNHKNYQLIQLTCTVFKITEQSHSFIGVIEDLICQQKLIEAAFCVSALHLQKEFPVEKILMPLLLDRRIQPAFLYMMNYPDLQLKVTKLLDNYLDKQKLLSSPYVNHRRVFKTLTLILNTFKIPIDYCPNMHLIRSRGAISILVNRRMEQSISESTFEDMLMSVVGENENLKKFLIEKLVFKKDVKTALRMAEKFNVTDMDLSSLELSDGRIDNGLADDKCEDVDSLSDLDNGLDEENAVNHLEFSLKTENLKVIANKEDFFDSINEISQNYKMIGIDSEWKPHFGLSRDRLSLIQLAVHDKVFIFDVLLLSECLEAEDWDKLFDDIFGNPNIIKLGCGIVVDVNMVLESIKGSKGKTIKFSHILDMALFYQKLKEVYPEKMNIEGDKIFTKGLSSLCDIILGKPLNKEDRLCDWEKRPLKESQLKYAALDAHCLLQMYDQLREDSIKKDINFDHLAKVAVVLTTSQWKPKRRFKGVKSGKAFHIYSPIPVDQLKVVVDSQFESQGKELRQLGADVIILQDNESSDIAVELSKTEGRVIVCSEKLWDQVKDRVKEGFCHYFPSSNDDPIKVSHFLQHFNVQVIVKSIYTRCIVCNSKDGAKLFSDDLKLLYGLKSTDSINFAIKDSLTSFSSELQVILTDILNSNINIKFSSSSHTLSNNECAFLCKNCGNIS